MNHLRADGARHDETAGVTRGKIVALAPDAMNQTTILRVLPALRGWKIHEDAQGRAVSIHERKEDAVWLARALAAKALARVVVHDELGDVAAE